MNSTNPLVSVYLFKKRVRKIPVHSLERISAVQGLTDAIEKCFNDTATAEVKKLLSSRYVCPVKYLPHSELNSKKLADTITSAILEPNIVKSLRFAIIPEEYTKEMLLALCKRSFGRYLTSSFRIIQGQGSLDFIVAM